jgi:hypothetical protein
LIRGAGDTNGIYTKEFLGYYLKGKSSPEWMKGNVSESDHERMQMR